MQNKFLFVLPTAILGGAERVAFNLIHYLLSQGDYVTLLIMSRGRQKEWDEFNNYNSFKSIIFDYDSEKTALVPLTFEISKLNKNSSFDFIFSTHTHINALLSILKKLGIFKNAKLISRESTFIFERFFGIKRKIFFMLYKFAYGGQDLLICQTKEMRNSLVRNLGFNPVKKISVISNPVNIKFIESKIDNTRKENLIVGCGRLISLKKFDYLINAFSEVVKINNQYKLVIIGDGPEEENLKNQVEKLGLTARVIFTGKIENPFEWFAKSKIGVISSEVEGFPNVLIEMMASGIQNVISTPCSDGVYEIPNIIITEKCSTKNIFDAIEYCINRNEDNSIYYTNYIGENRSISNYWNQIEKLL